MRTVIILLIVVLIGFGYLLSDNLDTHQDLEQTTLEKGRADSENQQLRDQLASERETNAQLNQQLEQVTREKETAENSLQTVRAENQHLSEALAVASTQLTDSEREKNTLKQEVATLRSSPEYVAAGNPEPFIPVTSANGSIVKVMPWLVAAGLPLSAILTYELNRRIRCRKNKRDSIMMQLTPEEKEYIIRLRRKK